MNHEEKRWTTKNSNQGYFFRANGGEKIRTKKDADKSVVDEDGLLFVGRMENNLIG